MKIKPIDRNSRLIKRLRGQFVGLLHVFFAKEKKKIAGQVVKAYREIVKEGTIHFDPRVQRILDQIDVNGFAVLFDDIDEILEAITKDGVTKALLQIGMKEDDITDQMSEAALEYARTKAAEMVGKKWIDGELVDNPNDYWAISESTREFLRSDVTLAVKEGWSTDRLAATIEGNYAFSASRSETIARTEIGNAHVEGSMVAYRESGLVAGKKWLLGSEHAGDDECNDNAADGIIPIDQPFSSGDMQPLAHPN